MCVLVLPRCRVLPGGAQRTTRRSDGCEGREDWEVGETGEKGKWVREWVNEWVGE